MTNSIANAKSALTSRIFFVRIQTLSFFCDVLNTHVSKRTQQKSTACAHKKA